MVLFCRAVFFIGGFHWISVKGRLSSAEEAPILATAPHSTYFDALPIVFFQLTTVVAKTAAARVLIFGSMLSCYVCTCTLFVYLSFFNLYSYVCLL